MNNSETIVRAIRSYYDDLNMYQFHLDRLDDPYGNLTSADKQRTEALVGRYKGQALQTLGYIKMRFLDDIKNAPSSMKELWGE